MTSHIDGVGPSLNDGIITSQHPQRASGDKATVGRLLLLDLSGNRIVSLNPDGSDRKVIVTGCRYPDGIAVDVAAGHMYRTNMGVPTANDGSIERADLDGQNRKTIVPQVTPELKQTIVDGVMREAGGRSVDERLRAGSL